MSLRHFLYTVFCVAVLAGCKRQPVVATPSGGYLALRQECVTLLEDYRRTKKESWGREDALPPGVASLKPQFVQVLSTSPAVIDIQTSGGFQHQGLLVVCDDAAKGYIPVKGRGWITRKVADCVFEYRE